MVMIPMECPKCGRRGSVPSNRVNTAFNCRKCSAPFYVNSQGDTILGEPPIDREAVKRMEAAKKKQKKEFEFNFDFSSLWSAESADERKRILMIGGACALVAAVVMYVVNMPSTDPLIERSVYVARAMADNDPVRVRAVATNDTSEDAGLWLERERTTLGITGSSRDYQITATALARAESDAEVIASLIPLNPGVANTPITADSVQDPRAKSFTSSGSTTPTFLSMQLSFNKDNSGQWRLDARKTLTNLEASRKQLSRGAQ